MHCISNGSIYMSQLTHSHCGDTKQPQCALHKNNYLNVACIYIYIYIYYILYIHILYKLILFSDGVPQFALHSAHSTSVPPVSLIGTHLQYVDTYVYIHSTV